VRSLDLSECRSGETRIIRQVFPRLIVRACRRNVRQIDGVQSPARFVGCPLRARRPADAKSHPSRGLTANPPRLKVLADEALDVLAERDGSQVEDAQDLPIYPLMVRSGQVRATRRAIPAASTVSTTGVMSLYA
jgi:hypothetical protein